jgi:hypothetical protein
MSHALTSRRPPRRIGVVLLPALAACLLLIGCGKTVDRRVADMREAMSFKMGDRWLVRPPQVINATRIDVTRDIVGPTGSAGDTQMLRIDLTNGRAVLETADGRVFPQQINAADVRTIHGLIAERDWQVRPIRHAKDAEQYAVYQLTVYEIDQPLKDQPIWHVPAQQPLPEIFQVLVDTFDVAHRYAYPLSNDVDLLE